MNINSWLRSWEQLHGAKVRPSTMRGYVAALAHLSPGFLSLEVGSVTGMDWEAEIYRIKAAYPRQAELAHIALRKAWKDGQRHQVIPWECNPWQYVDAPHHQAKETAYLLPEELPAYARAALQTPAALPLLLMVCLGLRRGEALGLAWEDVDTRGQLLHIRRQLIGRQSAPLKTNTSYRKIPLDTILIDKIYNLGDKSGFLLYNGTVKQLYVSHASALQAAGIRESVTLHGLRHSCATACLSEGADIKTVQAILGHASYTITADTYCHALMAPERAAIAAQVTRLEIA